jgi:L-fuconolactonase
MTPAHNEDTSERTAAAQARGDVVDSHMHLWDTTRLSYPWFAGVARLDRPYLPEHYRAQVPEPGDLVFVEAACRPEQALTEVAFIEEQTRDSGLPIAAIVAAVPVEDTAAREEHFAVLSQREVVRGVRRGLYGAPSDLVTGAGFREGLRATAEAGWVFDVSGHWSQLADVATAAEHVPEVVLVVDHVGKPPVAAGWDSADTTGWAEGMRRLAERPNAVVKLSGLVPETPPGLDLHGATAPFLHHVLDLFGPQRCMLGSDWPLSTSEPGPRGILAWQTIVLDSTGLSPQERAAVAADTARAVYRLPTRAPQ